MPPQETTSGTPLTWPQDECGANLPPMPNPPKLKEGGVFGLRLLRPSAVDTTTGVRLATVVLTVMSIPVLPLRRCRVVINAAGQPCFFGHVPLRAGDRLAQASAILAIVLLASLAFSNVASQHGTRDVSRFGGGPAPQERQADPEVISPATGSGPSSSNGTQHTSSPGQRSLASLRLSIDAGKAYLRTLEAQIQTIDSELDSTDSLLKSYDRDIERMKSEANLGLQVDEDAYNGLVARYNLLVPIYNKRLAEKRSLVATYGAELRRVNEAVAEYNASIR